MTPQDTVQDGLKEWIQLRTEQEYSALAGLQILTAADAETFDGSVIVIRDTGSVEHPVLRGVFEIGIEVELRTVAVPTVEDADAQESLEGTTKEQHKAMASALYNIVADVAAIQFLDTRAGLKCFDIRGVRPTTTAEDDLRASTFAMEVRACQI